MKSFPRISIGDKFGILTVLSPDNPTGNCKVTCRCDCGEIKDIRIYNLRDGYSKSCGCMARSAPARSLARHSMSGSPEYGIWAGIVQRCTNPNNTSYGHYGGRGITLAPSWLDFAHFIIDMGDRPSASHSIDRIDNDLGYCKENCRWATKFEQDRNKRSARWITYNGETKIIADWAKQYGIQLPTLIYRLRRDPDFEKAILTPVRKP